MISKIRNHITEFLNNNKDYPVVYAIAVGLYPIFFYYSNNYTLVNSLLHLAYFLFMFIGIPLLVFFLVIKINKFKEKVLTFSSVFIFLFLLKVCLFGDIQKKISLGILVISLIAGYFLFKHLKKIVAIQLIFAFIGFFALSNTIIKQHSISKEWMQQPDNIAEVEFVKKPNVYYIQPDGYVNFSELKKGYYNIENNSFETFLKSKDFTYYNDFRSNYALTLSSNKSSLMMKHHYYNNISNYKEVLNDRDIIISKNTVLDVFKNNGYRSYFITEMSYLLLNRPKMGFDYCNISYDDISFIGRGLSDFKEVLIPLKKGIKEKVDKPKFFFIQILAPSHVSGSKMHSLGVIQEKESWIKRFKRSNAVLTETISVIKENDPNALILIMADHGGYVGMKYTLESYEKMNDRDKIYSIFSSSLAIHWPNNKVPNYNKYLKSSVNVFRVIFSYLSENNSYLSNLQPDYSFAIVNKGALPGVYKYIDEKGEITFERISN